MTQKNPSIRIDYGATPPVDYQDDNVDVHVTFEDGREYWSLFITPANIGTLMTRYTKSGENLSGLYFCAPNLVIVRDISAATIEKTIHDLICEKALHECFEEIVEMELETDD